MKVADIAMHLLEAIEAGERKLQHPSAPTQQLRPRSAAMGGRAACLLIVVAATLGPVTTSPLVVHAETRTECAAGLDTPRLNSLIANELGDLVGFDTPRIIALPDGRNVWTVQDAFISANPDAALVVIATADGLRPQRACRAGGQLLHDAARANHAGRAMRRQRRVVRGQPT